VRPLPGERAEDGLARTGRCARECHDARAVTRVEFRRRRSCRDRRRRSPSNPARAARARAS
jgi:hypothetical protein